MIRLKRVYDRPSEDDGLRILVERLWPRGFTRARAAIELWSRDARMHARPAFSPG
ncbi:MAG: DUF488 family protein [Deltaproteobacteria bacterium]|nr:DUF488 family protein [Deltaproteobacteria bacterium]